MRFPFGMVLRPLRLNVSGSAGGSWIRGFWITAVRTAWWLSDMTKLNDWKCEPMGGAMECYLDWSGDSDTV